MVHLGSESWESLHQGAEDQRLALSSFFFSLLSSSECSGCAESRSRSSAEAILYQLTKLPSKEGGQEEEASTTSPHHSRERAFIDCNTTTS